MVIRVNVHTLTLSHTKTHNHTLSPSLSCMHTKTYNHSFLSLSHAYTSDGGADGGDRACAVSRRVYTAIPRGVLTNSERRRRLAACTDHHISTHQPQRLVPSQEPKARQTEITND